VETGRRTGVAAGRRAGAAARRERYIKQKESKQTRVRYVSKEVNDNREI
jgi:hypothetical protein